MKKKLTTIQDSFCTMFVEDYILGFEKLTAKEFKEKHGIVITSQEIVDEIAPMATLTVDYVSEILFEQGYETVFDSEDRYGWAVKPKMY